MSESLTTENLAQTPPIIQTPTLYKDKELDKMCKQYSTFLEFPELTTKQVKQIEGSLLKMLTRMDELGAILETCNTDASRIQQKMIPELTIKAQNLQKSFFVIDQIQLWLEETKRSVSSLEKQVEAAEEADYSITLKKVIGVFSNMLEGDRQEDVEQLEWHPVPIVDTKAFFAKLRKDVQTNT